MTVLYFGLYLITGISLLIRQPFGSPPDEFNRYLIPRYIAENGCLPNGYEESIRIGGYGFSYAFQPILPYMLQGYAMRFTGLFTDSPEAMLYTARGVNLFLGLLTARMVLLLSEKWFRDRKAGWIFAFLAAFLPQSIFVHTYVNTDSCCMLSIAVMLYGITSGLRDRFSVRSCLILAAGIILCALSYYNAYGYILSCILIFCAFFFTQRKEPCSAAGFRPGFDAKAFFKKGCFISVLVLLGIGWWFLRSALLYDGDFLGLRTRNECASLYALPQFHPDTRITWQNQGYSLWDMITGSDFCNLSILSFIGIYGPMTIITSVWVYRFYKALFCAGLILCAVLPGKRTCPGPFSERKGLNLFCHLNMLFCIAMPVFLSLIYSYTTDYQPQGRYLLPSLLPLCYYTVRGLEKLSSLAVPAARPGKKKRDGAGLSGCLCVLLCAVIAGMLLLTVYGYVFPYYAANPK